VVLANPNLIDPQALRINGDDYDYDIFPIIILKELEANRYLLVAQGHLMQFFILDTTPGHQQAIISKIASGEDCFSSPMNILNFVLFEEESLSIFIFRDLIKE
jgi:hypothetical protein